jgi:hypothetical protein
MGLEGGGQPITTIINEVASNLQRTVQREIIIKTAIKFGQMIAPASNARIYCSSSTNPPPLLTSLSFSLSLSHTFVKFNKKSYHKHHYNYIPSPAAPLFFLLS